MSPSKPKIGSVWVYSRLDNARWDGYEDGDAFMVTGYGTSKPDYGTKHTRPLVKLINLRTGRNTSACLFFFGPQYSPSMSTWTQQFHPPSKQSASKQSVRKWLYA